MFVTYLEVYGQGEFHQLSSLAGQYHPAVAAHAILQLASHHQNTKPP
jgi:hypothetical protein